MIDEADKSMEKERTLFLKSKSTPQGIVINFGKLGSMWSQLCALHVQIIRQIMAKLRNSSLFVADIRATRITSCHRSRDRA